MKQFIVAVLVVLVGHSALGQTSNQPLTDQSILTFTGAGGRRIVFSIPEAKTNYDLLWSQVDPARPSNGYMPPYLKERLAWLRQYPYIVNDPNLPANWGSKQFQITNQAQAAADYCRIPGVSEIKPCVRVYVSMVILDMKLTYNLSYPDERFRNHFAMAMAHEGVHHENSQEWFMAQHSVEQRAREEIRTWHKVVRDMAAPLRKSGHPISTMYEGLDDLLKPCGYKLPCKQFEDAIRRDHVEK